MRRTPRMTVFAPPPLFTLQMASRMTHLPSHTHRRSKRRAALTLALLCLVAAVGSVHAEPAGRFDMHRTGAGTPGADGWTEATSSQGGFSVRLPCSFNDFTFAPASGDVVRTDALGCGAGGVKYAATRLQYRDSALATQTFDGFAAADKWPNSTIERNDYRGLASISHRFEDSTRCGLMRVVNVGDTNLLLSVEATNEHCGIVQTSGTQFLDSLTLESPAIRAASVVPPLPECPLELELSPAQIATAFDALPRDQEVSAGDDCLPATVSRVLMRRAGVCRIGQTDVAVVGLVTRKETGEPVSIIFMAPYTLERHSALQSLLEKRYTKQSLSIYRRPLSVTEEHTTLVTQPRGTMLILGKPSPGMPGSWMSTVQQVAPDNVDLANRNLNTCR
jgi:hypothetical protein